MITQMVDLNQFHQRAMQIRARVPVILSHWGLLPKFSRWRLAQDPETGLVVLFAVLHQDISLRILQPRSMITSIPVCCMTWLTTCKCS